MSQPIRFAVIGFGHIGRQHVRFIQNCPGAELAAIVDADATTPLHTAYPKGIQFFSSIGELAARTSVDVVNVCTPNYLHVQHSIEALESGFHVVCEKPLGITKNSCEKLIRIALQKNKQVFVVMQNRFSPTATWLKNLVTQGTLGALYTAQVHCYWNRDDRYYTGTGWKGKLAQDGGVLYTQFSHFIDMLYWTFGDINPLQAQYYNYNHQTLTEFEDTGTVLFDFVKQGSGSIHYTTAVWDKNMESTLTVIAENGSLRIGGQYMDTVTHCHIKDYVFEGLTPHPAQHSNGEYRGNEANHFRVIQNVVNTLKGSGEIHTNALEGLKVVEIIERMYALRP